MANPLQTSTTQPKGVIQINNTRPGRGGYEFSGGTKGSGDMRDQVRNKEKAAGMARSHDLKAQFFAALQANRAKAIAEGAMEGSLPEIHANMSDADLSRAAKVINRARRLPENHDFGAEHSGTSKNPSSAASGAQVPHPELQSRTKDTGRNSGQQQGPVAPQAVPMTAPAGPLGALQNIAATAMQRAANAPDASAPVPSDTPQAPASSTGNPLRDKLIHDGTIRPDAKFEQTPAGMSVEMQSASGPRQVQFQPTGEQALEAKYGNVAMQQYGKPFSQLEPGQRATILRANPVSRVRGEVLASGQGQFNQRGERFLDTTGGVIKEVDPSQDTTLTRIAKGDSLLPQNAEGGLLVPEKYAGPGGNRVAYVTRGTPIPSQDPAQDPQMRATPPAAAPAPAPAPQQNQAPTAPQQQPSAPMDKKTVPQDPALLAKNPVAFATRMAGDATPLGLQAPGAGRVPQAPTPLNTPAPAPAPTPDPVEKAWESGPAVAGTKGDSNVLNYPETGGMAFQHNTVPKADQPLRTKGVFDALVKGNLSEMAAHINRADTDLTQKAYQATRGTAFEGSPADPLVRRMVGAPAPQANNIATTPNPTAPTEEEKNKTKNPLANL